MTASESSLGLTRWDEVRLWIAVVALCFGTYGVYINYFQAKDIKETATANAQSRIEADVKSCIVGNTRAGGVRTAISNANFQSVYDLTIKLGGTPEEAEANAETAQASAARAATDTIKDRDCLTVDGATPELVQEIYESVNQ